MTTMTNDLLLLAKQQIFNELIDTRTKDLDKWMVESNISWKEKGIIIPAPPFMVFPTQEQILKRAEELKKEREKPKEEVSEKIIEKEIETKPVEPVIEKVTEEIKDDIVPDVQEPKQDSSKTITLQTILKRKLTKNVSPTASANKKV